MAREIKYTGITAAILLMLNGCKGKMMDVESIKLALPNKFDGVSDNTVFSSLSYLSLHKGIKKEGYGYKAAYMKPLRTTILQRNSNGTKAFNCLLDMNGDVVISKRTKELNLKRDEANQLRAFLNQIAQRLTADTR